MNRSANPLPQEEGEINEMHIYAHLTMWQILYIRLYIAGREPLCRSKVELTTVILS